MSRLLISMALGLFGLLIATAAVHAEGDPKKGETIFALCMGCHGTSGEGNQAIGAPRNGGRNSWYLLRQIANFKAGIRGANPKDTFGVQMPPIVATLQTQQDVEDVVAYLGTLKPPILPHTITGGDVNKGKETWRVCASCHGDDGKGIELLGSPQIAGVPDWYLLRQLNNFKTGLRGTHKDDIFGRQMAVVQELMLPDEQSMLDVITYINTLPPE